MFGQVLSPEFNAMNSRTGGEHESNQMSAINSRSKEDLTEEKENPKEKDEGANYNNFVDSEIKPSSSKDQDSSSIEEEDLEDDDDNPLLYVDVNLGPGKAERIIVYEDDTAEGLADKFALKHKLNELMRKKLVDLLQNEINSLLSRIEEESSSEFN